MESHAVQKNRSLRTILERLLLPLHRENHVLEEEKETRQSLDRQLFHENTVFPIEQRAQRESCRPRPKTRSAERRPRQCGNKVCQTKLANPGPEEEDKLLSKAKNKVRQTSSKTVGTRSVRRGEQQNAVIKASSKEVHRTWKEENRAQAQCLRPGPVPKPRTGAQDRLGWNCENRRNHDTVRKSVEGP